MDFPNGKTGYRIQRIKDGLLGGYIQSEENLSQLGKAWVFDGAWVFGNAVVYGDARVSGNVRIYGDVKLYGDTRLTGNSWVWEGRNKE